MVKPTPMKNFYILAIIVVVASSILGALVSFPPPQAIIRSSTLIGNTISLAWDKSPDTNVVGYRIYYGDSFGSRQVAATVGNVTNATIDKLIAGQNLFTSVVSYNSIGVESEPSNTVTNYIFPKVSTRVYVIAADATAPNKTNTWQVSRDAVTWHNEKTIVTEVGSQITVLVTNDSPMKLIRLR